MKGGEKKDLVSVIVPVFNGADYLRESIDSILAQTYRPIEVIVADDASTDETPEILEEYGNRLKVIRQEENLGIYENANRAIDQARGEFIAVFHADDIYLPKIVEKEVNFLRSRPDVGAVFCADIFVDAEGREYHRLELPEEFEGGGVFEYEAVVNGLLRYTNTFLRCPGTMVRAQTYEKVGGYRQEIYKNSSDLDMWLLIAREFDIGILDEHLYKYRHFVNNSSQQYHHLRTRPNRCFRIIDDHLELGAREVAREEALKSYEAHRAQDGVMRAISHYIRGELPEARHVLQSVDASALSASQDIQRWRMLLLYAIMTVLSRLPRVEFLADAMLRRWHSTESPS